MRSPLHAYVACGRAVAGSAAADHIRQWFDGRASIQLRRKSRSSLFNTHALAGSPNRERRPQTCEQRQLAPLPVAIHVCEAYRAEPSELGFDVEQLVRGILL